MKKSLLVERTLVSLLPYLSYPYTLEDYILTRLGQGQRQLLALARGLLKLHNSSFLIMDESTANLDHATDQTIQNVLRTGLKDTQMLVIAHRLLTVVELDK
jgi:ABC-type multidrug transport system fused ATPase/permease subunit